MDCFSRHDSDGGAAHRYGIREFIEKRDAFFPSEAGIGNALAVVEGLAGYKILPPGLQMALDHHADDARVAASVVAADLFCDVAADFGLASIIFLAIGMAEIDHEPLRK